MEKRRFKKLRQHPKGFAFASGPGGKDAFVPPGYRACKHVLAGAAFEAETQAASKGPRVTSHWLACESCAEKAREANRVRQEAAKVSRAREAVAKAAKYFGTQKRLVNGEWLHMPMPPELEVVVENILSGALSTASKKVRGKYSPSEVEKEVSRLKEEAVARIKSTTPKTPDQRPAWGQMFPQDLIHGSIIQCSCGNRAEYSKIECGVNRWAPHPFNDEKDGDSWREPAEGHTWTNLSKVAQEELKELKKGAIRSGAWVHWATKSFEPALVELDGQLVWGMDLRVNHRLSDAQLAVKTKLEAERKARYEQEALERAKAEAEHAKVQAQLAARRKVQWEAEKERERQEKAAEKKTIAASGGLVDFTAWHRRGGSNQGGAWVINPDGMLRRHDRDDIPRHKKDGNLTWDFIRPEELVLKYTKDHRKDPFVCTVVQTPKEGLTQAQFEYARQIEDEIGAHSGAFGLTAPAEKQAEPVSMEDAMAKLLGKWGDKRKKK